jgi:transposase
LIALLPGNRVFAYAAPTDMRKGYDSLSALVVEEMRGDVLSGDLYLFVARNRIRAKVLVFDGTGLCLFAKRIEKGRFACLWRQHRGSVLEMSRSELGLFLEGSQMIGRKRLTPKRLSQRDLAIDNSM